MRPTWLRWTLKSPLSDRLRWPKPILCPAGTHNTPTPKAKPMPTPIPNSSSNPNNFAQRHGPVSFDEQHPSGCPRRRTPNPHLSVWVPKPKNAKTHILTLRMPQHIAHSLSRRLYLPLTLSKAVRNLTLQSWVSMLLHSSSALTATP